MHRTEGVNHSGNLFTDGPPGTTVGADILNAFQEEIAYAVEQSGLTIQTAATETRQQLKSAIDALADARIVVADEGTKRKNSIINGDMRVSQRATAWDAGGTNPPNNDDVYVLDRWVLLSDGNDIVDVTQTTTVPTASFNSIGLDVETIDKKFGILQVIEEKNCYHMAGENVSFSFQAKVTSAAAAKLDNIKAVVLTWGGAADTVTSDVVNAWNGEDTTPTWAANWTARNTPANLGVTTSWVKYEIPSIAIPAGEPNVAVFIWSDAFCGTLAEFLHITDVQLEVGNSVTTYDVRSIEEELNTG